MFFYINSQLINVFLFFIKKSLLIKIEIVFLIYCKDVTLRAFQLTEGIKIVYTSSLTHII